MTLNLSMQTGFYMELSLTVYSWQVSNYITELITARKQSIGSGWLR